MQLRGGLSAVFPRAEEARESGLCTGADLWPCRQPSPAQELAVAGRPGTAAHAKSASQIGVTAPLGMQASSFELPFNSFSLLT